MLDRRCLVARTPVPGRASYAVRSDNPMATGSHGQWRHPRSRSARRAHLIAGLVVCAATSASCASILGFDEGTLAVDGGSAGAGPEAAADGAGLLGADAAGDGALGSDALSGGDATVDAPADGAIADAADGGNVADGSDGGDAGDAGPKQAFETPLTFNGRLDANGVAGAGGLAAGDARCHEAASATFPGRTFVAWLSTTSASAASRLAGGGPWYVGATYLGGVNELTTGTLKTALAKAPNGAAVPAPLGVWTGTEGDGTANAARCIDWTSILNADAAEIGTSGAAGIFWTYATARSCDSTYHLYCFEK